jgi:hypothetical protein
MDGTDVSHLTTEGPERYRVRGRRGSSDSAVERINGSRSMATRVLGESITPHVRMSAQHPALLDASLRSDEPQACRRKQSSSRLHGTPNNINNGDGCAPSTCGRQAASWMQITHLSRSTANALRNQPPKISKAVGASVRLEDRVDHNMVPIQNNPRWYDQHCSAIRHEPPYDLKDIPRPNACLVRRAWRHRQVIGSTTRFARSTIT